MKSFLLLLLSVSFFSVKAQQVDKLFLDAAIHKLQNSKAYTISVAELMPDEKYGYKPAVTEMSFGTQLLHICSNLAWLSSSFLGNTENPVTPADTKLQSKATIIEVLNKTYNYAIEGLQHFDGAQLGDTVKFFAGPMNKLQIINLVNDHQTHHRGQLMVYLRLNGIKPPDYVGW